MQGQAFLILGKLSTSLAASSKEPAKILLNCLLFLINCANFNKDTSASLMND